MRLFLALNLPPELRDAVHEAAAPLREAAPSLAWTAADKLHLTVKFLGECADEAVSPLAAALAPVAERHAPALLELRGVGAFPRLQRPRVYWVGVRPDPRLELLQHDVEHACEALGHAVEGRPFRPHVTLGRVTPRAHPLDARAVADAARRVHVRASAVVPTLDLMRSVTAPGGSRYTAVARLPFANRG